MKTQIFLLFCDIAFFTENYYTISLVAYITDSMGNPHSRPKRLPLNHRFRQLLDGKHNDNLNNIKLLYNSTNMAVQLRNIWGSAKPSNLHRIQTFQSTTHH